MKARPWTGTVCALIGSTASTWIGPTRPELACPAGERESTESILICCWNST
jgi:hypothetical protein